MPDAFNYYGRTYSQFSADLSAEIRREAFGEDIGQNSWLTADEYRQCFRWLELKPESYVLEIACGSGGPALFMARTTGCRILGVDYSADGVVTANQMAAEQGMSDRLHFQQGDASQPLSFGDQTFDAVVCIDAINHLAGRLNVLKEWNRVLKPGGCILFTDPITITGLLSSDEIAIRSSIGFFLYAAPEEDARLIKEAGFELVLRQDATEAVAQMAQRRHDARAKHEADLIQLEGEEAYQKTQKFFEVAHLISSERRLSRFIFVARKA